MDLRYALRVLARTPGFTLMAIATLALGIGINTVVFTVYGSVAFHALGVRAPGEIERIQWSREGYPEDLFSWADFERLTAASGPFASLVATSDPERALCDREVANIRFVSGNYFDALGVKAQLGRTMQPSDRRVAVVSSSYWKRRLYSDREVYGRSIKVGGAALTIVGVAPESFEGTGEPAQVPDLWIAASDQTAVLPGVDWLHDPAAREWQLLGRRAAGVSHQQAEAALSTMGAGWPADVSGKPLRLTSLPATFFQTDSGEFRGFTLICGILLLAVMLVLAMGCINLVNLIVARNAARGQEIALRLALGASRFRLMRQLCSESLLLGLAGGAAGLLLSTWSCAWLTVKAASLLDELSGGSLHPQISFVPDWRTFLVSAGLSILTGLAVGLGPALRASNRNVSGALRQAGSAGGLEVTRRRNVLLSIQVASCLVLLTAAGLLFRGAARSPLAQPGFDAAHTVLMSVDAQTVGSPAVLQRAVEQLKSTPGVRAVSWADRAPFLGHGSRAFTNEAGARLNCIFNGVSRDYFETLGIPLVAGRNFMREETETGAPVAVISESTARRLWPGASALGRRIVNGDKSYTVIGVAKTVRSTYLSKADEGYVYLAKPLPQTFALLLVRTAGAPERMFRTLSAALGSVNSNLPAVTDTLAIGDSPLKSERWMAEAPALASGVLGGLALLLACLGIFGVVSRLVALRTREIGIRMALGARRSDVVAMVGNQTLKPVLWGAVVGLAGALGVSGVLQALIVMPDVPDLTYGAGAFDPVTFLGVLAALIATVAVAGIVPMRRALNVEPAVALRDQ